MKCRDCGKKLGETFLNKPLGTAVKEKGKMPYYIGQYEQSSYQNKKRIFALEEMNETGFLQYLLSFGEQYQQNKNLYFLSNFQV